MRHVPIITSSVIFLLNFRKAIGTTTRVCQLFFYEGRGTRRSLILRHIYPLVVFGRMPQWLDQGQTLIPGILLALVGPT